MTLRDLLNGGTVAAFDHVGTAAVQELKLLAQERGVSLSKIASMLIEQAAFQSSE